MARRQPRVVQDAWRGRFVHLDGSFLPRPPRPATPSHATRPGRPSLPRLTFCVPTGCNVPFFFSLFLFTHFLLRILVVLSFCSCSFISINLRTKCMKYLFSSFVFIHLVTFLCPYSIAVLSPLTLRTNCMQ